MRSYFASYIKQQKLLQYTFLNISLILGKQTGDPETSIPPSKGIVQKYITNPLLIGQEKLKFDVRCYLLVARTEPKVLAFYHPGYCRLTLKSFTMAMEKLGDSSIHLTNAAIQKKDPLYKEMKEKQVNLIIISIRKHLFENCGSI